MKGLKLRSETMEFLKENVGAGVGNRPQRTGNKRQTDQMALHQIQKLLLSAKGIINRMEKKIFANCLFDTGIITQVYQNLKSTVKIQQIQLGNRQQTSKDSCQKKKHKGQQINEEKVQYH